MPLLVIGGDRLQQHVPIRIIAAAVRSRLSSFDADLGNEAQAVKVTVGLDLPRLLCGLARILGSDAARGFENCAEQGAVGFPHLTVAIGGANHGQQGPKFSPCVVAIEDAELAIERFGTSVLGALEPTSGTCTAAANMHLDSGDSAGRNQFGAALLSGCIVEIHGHRYATCCCGVW